MSIEELSEQEQQEFRKAVKASLLELTDTLTKSEVDCMICVFAIGDKNYNFMFGDVVEITKLILSVRNESEDFNAIMNVQSEVQNTINKAVNMMYQTSNKHNPSVN